MGEKKRMPLVRTVVIVIAVVAIVAIILFVTTDAWATYEQWP